MKRVLIWLAMGLGMVGLVLLAVGTAQELAVGLLVIGLIAAPFTVGGAAGASTVD